MCCPRIFIALYHYSHQSILSHLSLVVDDDVRVVRHDQMLPEGRLVHRVLPALLLEHSVYHGVVGTFGGEGGVRHQGAVHAVPSHNLDS